MALNLPQYAYGDGRGRPAVARGASRSRGAPSAPAVAPTGAKKKISRATAARQKKMQERSVFSRVANQAMNSKNDEAQED